MKAVSFTLINLSTGMNNRKAIIIKRNIMKKEAMIKVSLEADTKDKGISEKVTVIQSKNFILNLKSHNIKKMIIIKKTSSTVRDSTSLQVTRNTINRKKEIEVIEAIEVIEVTEGAEVEVITNPIKGELILIQIGILMLNLKVITY